MTPKLIGAIVLLIFMPIILDAEFVPKVGHPGLEVANTRRYLIKAICKQ